MEYDFPTGRELFRLHERLQRQFEVAQKEVSSLRKSCNEIEETLQTLARELKYVNNQARKALNSRDS